MKRQGTYNKVPMAKRARRAKPFTSRTVEVKEFLLNYNTPLAANAFLATNLTTSIVQGSGSSNRIGNKIRIKSVELCGSMGTPQAQPTIISLIGQKPNSAFTTSDFNGPFVYNDTAIVHDFFISDAIGGQSFRLSKYYSGLGKTVVFDKDSSAPVGEHPAFFIQNPNGAATVAMSFFWRLRFTDV